MVSGRVVKTSSLLPDLEADRGTRDVRSIPLHGAGGWPVEKLQVVEQSVAYSVILNLTAGAACEAPGTPPLASAVDHLLVGEDRPELRTVDGLVPEVGEPDRVEVTFDVLGAQGTSWPRDVPAGLQRTSHLVDRSRTTAG